jgi:hypothetical protein
MRNLIIILCIGVLLTGPIAATAVKASADDHSKATPTARIDGIDWDEWLEGIPLTWDEFLGYMGMTWDQWENFLRIDGIDWDEWMDGWTVPSSGGGGGSLG